MTDSASDDFALDEFEDEGSQLEQVSLESQTRQIDSVLSDSQSDSVPHGSFPSTSFAVNIQKPVQPECEYKAGEFIGRYEIIRKLGTGGFGHVLLCMDPQLRRQVAIKIPRADRVDCADESFLEEGRAVARLDHPGIVRLHNIEQTDDAIPFVVMEFIEGPTLRDVIKDKGMTFSRAIDILIQIAEALEYAHSKTLIHRDLKPANVIIAEETNQAKLMDFGMALHDLTPEENLTSLAEGTPPYMAPEQIRGENHRLDRRTDIWGFGTLMYVLLTGRRPFNGSDTYELLEKICLSEPISPKRINKEVPDELERICLKCLEKLMNSRYENATQLGEDLKSFQMIWNTRVANSPDHDSSGILPLSMRPDFSERLLDTNPVSNVSEVTAESHVRVVPKGLRSFDSQDAEFFLDLLPGAKDRFGIPDSLRFWLNKFSNDATDPLTVGLIFGPSGCGKSSFVKAGLVPRLPREFKTIYLEATPHETEATLLAKIGDLAPDVVGDNPSLPVALSRIRRGHLIKGQRLLIVIDQFEQWLQTNNELVQSPLIEALRHCDGQQLCCILLIRDDFWMSATRFMAQLDLKVQEGVNALGIPLFDRRHARKVLTAYGRANQAIRGEPTADQKKFVASSVDELSENGDIIPIHLSLFSQMMDSDSWQLAKLKKMGGWQGIGAQFLEKMFSDKRVSRHSETCREILKMLLPPATSEIKGTHKSYDEIAKATGFTNKPEQLQGLLDLLDREMRIITLTEQEVGDDRQATYQLTHDFLVNPVRKWITQKEKQTWQGRAGIRLDELSRQWQSQHEGRYMPGLFEYVPMFFGVDRKSCSANERHFMKQAGRYYGIRAAIALFAIASIAFLGRSFWKQTRSELAREKTQMLMTASAAEVDARLEALDDFDRSVIDQVVETELATAGKNVKSLHAFFAKARFASIDQLPLAQILDSIEWADHGECPNIISALDRLTGTAREHELRQGIQDRFDKTESSDHQIRLAIVALFLDDSSLAKQVLKFSQDPELRERFIDLFPEWRGKNLKCIELIDSIDDIELASGMMKSLGLFIESLNPTERNKLVEIVSKRIRHANEPVVFSCCEWLLLKLGKQLPDDLTIAENKNWMVKRYLHDTTSLVFVRVEAHRVPGLAVGLPQAEINSMQVHPQWREGDEDLDDSFYMTSSEVPAKLYFEFVDSLKEDDPTRIYAETELKELRILSGESLPIHAISWYQACQFCNWLSVRDGLQPHYVKSTFKINENSSQDVWNPGENTNGYRLPTLLQWDAANRCRTTSKFSFGLSSARLSRYAVTSLHQFKFDNLKVDISQQKMPNDFGFFDLQGNASEWCEDSPTNVSNVYSRALRGGDSAGSGIKWFYSGFYYVFPSHQIGVASGFRLVLPTQ